MYIYFTFLRYLFCSDVVVVTKHSLFICFTVFFRSFVRSFSQSLDFVARDVSYYVCLFVCVLGLARARLYAYEFYTEEKENERLCQTVPLKIYSFYLLIYVHVLMFISAHKASGEQ